MTRFSVSTVQALCGIALLLIVANAKTSNALSCFCNEPGRFNSDCDEARSECSVSELGCCYQHLKKMPVPNRNPAGDLRSDYYGCIDEPIQCMIGKSDMLRDGLYAVCDDGNHCNQKDRKTIIYQEKRHRDMTEEDREDVEKTNMKSYKTAIAVGVILGCLLLLASVIATAVICVRQTLRSKQRQQPDDQLEQLASYGRTPSSDSGESQSTIQLSPPGSTGSSPEWTGKAVREETRLSGSASDEGTEVTFMDIDGPNMHVSIPAPGDTCIP
eukprot:scpid17943/ scgid19354/ 